MAEILKDFKFPPSLRKNKMLELEQYMDGKCWKISPDEHDLDPDEDNDIKCLVNRLKSCARKLGVHVKIFQTLDRHVILQKVILTPEELKLTNERRDRLVAARKALKEKRQKNES